MLPGYNLVYLVTSLHIFMSTFSSLNKFIQKKHPFCAQEGLSLSLPLSIYSSIYLTLMSQLTFRKLNQLSPFDRCPLSTTLGHFKHAISALYVANWSNTRYIWTHCMCLHASFSTHYYPNIHNSGGTTDGLTINLRHYTLDKEKYKNILRKEDIL